MVTKLMVAVVVSAIGMLLIIVGIAYTFICSGPLSHGAITAGAVLVAAGTLFHYFVITKKKR